MKSVIDFLIDDYERELDDFKEWGMNYDHLEYARKNIRDYVDALQARAEKAEAMVERMIERVDKVKNTLSNYFRLFHAPNVGSFLDDWNALVAEWKEREG